MKPFFLPGIKSIANWLTFCIICICYSMSFSQGSGRAEISVNISSARTAPISITAQNLTTSDSIYVASGMTNEPILFPDVFIKMSDNSTITGLQDRMAYKHHTIIFGNPSSILDAYTSLPVNEARMLDITGRLVVNLRVINHGDLRQIQGDLENVPSGVYIILTDLHSFRFNKSDRRAHAVTTVHIEAARDHFQILNVNGQTDFNSAIDKSSTPANATSKNIDTGARKSENPNYNFFWNNGFGIVASDTSVVIQVGANNVQFTAKELPDAYFSINGQITNADNGRAILRLNNQAKDSVNYSAGKFSFRVDADYEANNTVKDFPNSSVVMKSLTSNFKTTIFPVSLTGNFPGENKIDFTTAVELIGPVEQKGNVFVTLRDGSNMLIANYRATVNDVPVTVLDTLKIRNVPLDSVFTISFTENDNTSINITELEKVISNLQAGNNNFTFKTTTTPWYAHLLVHYTNGANISLQSEGKSALSNAQGNATITNVTTLPNRVSSKNISASHSGTGLVSKNSTYSVHKDDNSFTETLQVAPPNPANFSVRLKNQSGQLVENILVTRNGVTTPVDSVYTIINTLPGNISLTFSPSDSTYQLFSSFPQSFTLVEGNNDKTINKTTTPKTFSAVYTLDVNDVNGNTLQNMTAIIDGSTFVLPTNGVANKNFVLSPNPQKPWLAQNKDVNIKIQDSDSSFHHTNTPKSYIYAVKEGANTDVQSVTSVPFVFPDANLLVTFKEGTTSLEGVLLQSNGKSATSNTSGLATITSVIPITVSDPVKFWLSGSVSTTYNASKDGYTPINNKQVIVTSGNKNVTQLLEKIVQNTATVGLRAKHNITTVTNADVVFTKLDNPSIQYNGNTGSGSQAIFENIPIDVTSSKYIVEYTVTQDSNLDFLPTKDTFDISKDFIGWLETQVNKIPNHQDKEFFTYDETSRQLINGVNVEIYDANTNTLVGTKVSSNGKVSFNDLTPGEYYLSTSKSGNFTEGGPEYKFTIISPQTATDTIAFYTNLAMLQKTGNLTAAYINEMEGRPNPEMVTGRGKIYLPSGYERAAVLAAIQDGDAILGTTTTISDTPGNITSTMDANYNPWNNYYEGQWIFNATYGEPLVSPQYKYVNLDNKIINQKVMHNPSQFSVSNGSFPKSTKKEVFGRLYNMQPVGSRPSLMNDIATDITPIDVEVWNAIVTGQKNMFEYKDANGNPIDFYPHYNLSE